MFANEPSVQFEIAPATQVGVALHGVLDEAAACWLRSTLGEVIASRRGVLLDLWLLERIDGAGVQALVELSWQFRAAGAELRVTGLHGQPAAALRALAG